MVNREERMSIRRQCKLVSVSRASFYYKPLGESEENLKIMRLMDEHYLEHPLARRSLWLDVSLILTPHSFYFSTKLQALFFKRLASGRG